MRIRIGYAYLDRLLSYPDVRYLSGCCLPIRMLLTYPDVAYLSGCELAAGGYSFLCGCNRACLCVAAEPPATWSLTRMRAAFRLVAKWCYTT